MSTHSDPVKTNDNGNSSFGESEVEGASMSPPAFQLMASGSSADDAADVNQAQNRAKATHSAPLQAKAAGDSAPLQLQLEQPIVTQAPDTAIGIEEFIQLVEAEEQRAGNAVLNPDGSFNTALMITRLRQIFYGSDGWNEKLVPGTADVDNGYETRERERGRREVDLYGPNVDVVDTETYPVDAAGNTPEIYTRQEIALPDGSFLDIGHVFAGLDAFNHPADVSAPLFSYIEIENGGGTTWVGDLGSVLAEIIFACFNAGTNTVSESVTQGIINEYASPQDMLGNIDAYAIDEFYDTDSNSGQRVSEILRHYYLGEGVQANQSRRYSTFATRIGLTGWNGSGWTNEAARITHFTDQVNDAGALYFAAGADLGPLNLAGASGAILGTAENEYAGTLVALFFDALRTKVAAE